MRVRYAVPLVLVLAALLPAAAPGAACSPLDCGPAGLTVAGGRSLALTVRSSTSLFDLSTGRVRAVLGAAVVAPDGKRAVAQAARLLRTYDLATGRVVARTRIASGWTLAGVSTDASRVVLFGYTNGTTRVQILGAGGARTLAFDGRFGFDGLLGSRLYLIQYVQNGYLVRAADLATGRLQADPLKDADEPALISGQAWSRVASHDGRYLFTVYLTSAGGAMIHELDMRDGKAWCVDLPGSGDYNAAGSYALALSRDGKRLYAAGAAYGAVVTIDVAAHRVVHTTRIAAVRPNNPSLPSASLSPDGKTLAFSNAGMGWLFDLGAGRVIKTTQLAADAVLAYSPSGRVWSAGRGSVLQPAFA